MLQVIGIAITFLIPLALIAALLSAQTKPRARAVNTAATLVVTALVLFIVAAILFTAVHIIGVR